MKRKWHFIIFLIFFLIGQNVFAQKLKKKRYSYGPDFALCQENHSIIIQEFLNLSDSKFSFVVYNMSSGEESFESVLASGKFDKVLSEILMDRVIYEHLLRKLNSRSLENFLRNPENEGKSFLSTDNISIDLNSQVGISLKNFPHKLNTKQLTLLENSTRNFLTNMATKAAVSKGTSSVLTGTVRGIISAQKGSLFLKSFYLSLANNVLISSGRSVLLEIFTMPLKAYRYPPHTLWNKVLEKHPSLIILPELMSHAGIEDHPWIAHCQALEQNTKLMESFLNKAILQKDESYYELTNNLRYPPRRKSDFQTEEDIQTVYKKYPIKQVEPESTRTHIPRKY